jgi:hypothetical protein
MQSQRLVLNFTFRHVRRVTVKCGLAMGILFLSHRAVQGLSALAIYSLTIQKHEWQHSARTFGCSPLLRREAPLKMLERCTIMTELSDPMSDVNTMGPSRPAPPPAAHVHARCRRLRPNACVKASAPMPCLRLGA